MNRINLRGIFCFVSLFICFCFAQETHNLEIIWIGRLPTSTIGVPESCQTYGYTLSSGDLNGDSLSDLVVNSMPVFWVGAIDTPTCYVLIYYGRTVLDSIPDIILKAENPFDAFGYSICTGDINGDGFCDLMVGAPMSTGSAPARLPRVYVYLGPLIYNDTLPDYILYGREGSAYAGAIDCGDVNGDLIDDIIVGAYTDWPMPGGFLMGRVYIYYGSQNFDVNYDVILNGGHQGELEGFGTTVGSGGDVNGDGYADVIVGAPNFAGERGRIYIYYGGNPMNNTYDVAMIGEVPFQSLGWTPTVNILETEFEYDMAVFGSAFWPYGFPRVGSGKIYVLFGGEPMDSIPDIWMIGRTESTGLGQCVSKAGFVNYTNSEGIISGVPNDFNGCGTAYLWLDGNVLDTTPDAWIRGINSSDGIGWLVNSAGDVNGDGKDEIMVSNYAAAHSIKRVWVCKYTGPGVEERQTLDATRLTLEVNPNPAKSYLAVRLPHTANRQMIKIFDVSGKLVVEERITSAQEQKQEIRISLKEINPGIYFLQIGTELKKFLVVR